MPFRVLMVCSALGCLFGCAGPRAQPDHHYIGQPDKRLETSEQVSSALAQAQAAYLEGKWGNTVAQANQVMEGAASPEEYYLAVKLLGMASCNRKDPGPVAFSWSRLDLADREGLRRECEQNGLAISDQGLVSQQKRP